ncbi:Di-N-acetylchitobiase [Seminavis robusta]|uniref:Di-N-acetylchitobiase n=1 Tax=Seminavis robusta TaxID=568900 RepID=A0A9N8DCU7_9STRA|nr:Di-N-acetylchitobiase [Seminavis robusta]|eukprot:Sro61_g034930.1 Di-N-acetylchitobiase (459) ;mRNA; f:32849-34225
MLPVVLVFYNLLLAGVVLAVEKDQAWERVKRFQRQSKEQRQFSDEWIAHQFNNKDGDHHYIYQSPCPCSDPQLCQPISSNDGFPIRTTGEVYGFAGGKEIGQNFNWTHISTVAWANEDELMCQAHKHNSRAVVATPSFNLTHLAELNDKERQSQIQEWIDKTLSMVKSRHRDGVVFDYEGPLGEQSGEIQAYVALINATRQAFHSKSSSPPLQVTTCVPWSTNCIDGRCYPYRRLADVSDLVYVMDYDTQSQITQGPCIANANAPLAGMKQGILEYIRLGVDPAKIILGVPWYGYQYPCLEGTKLQDRFCPIPLKPFRGVDCSDAAGWEVPYSTLLSEWNTTLLVGDHHTPPEHSTTRTIMPRDDYMGASYFNMMRERNGKQVVHQNWLDDPTSLSQKFTYAKSMQLGGVGPFQLGDLNPSTQPKESQAMWAAFDSFFPDKDGDDEDTTPEAKLMAEQ